MAKELSPTAAAAEEEKARIKEEKKQFKQEQKERKKEAKRRAAEIAKQEEALGEDGGSGLVTFLATILIVILWLAIVCVVLKMDIGGFGSSVLRPILKDVPVINMILPAPAAGTEEVEEGYGGYASIQEAVEYIKSLELQLEQAQTASKAKDAEIDTLKAEVLRLQEFEQKQAEFQRIKTEFYEEVVYTDKAPGLEEYRKYYEAMDAATAEYIYRQVVTQMETSAEAQSYIQTFAEMKPKSVARMFENMTDNLDLVAEILEGMGVDKRAAVMDAIDAELGARLIKMMHPDS